MKRKNAVQKLEEKTRVVLYLETENGKPRRIEVSEADAKKLSVGPGVVVTVHDLLTNKSLDVQRADCGAACFCGLEEVPPGRSHLVCLKKDGDIWREIREKFFGFYPDEAENEAGAVAD